MKFLSLNKNDGCLVVAKKTKEFMSIDNNQSCMDFIHKKNPNKGKISSKKLIGPIQIKKNYYWILYYTSPLNKNSNESDWTFIINNKPIKTFNGIMIIKNKSSSNLSNLCDVIDFETDEIESFRDKLVYKNMTQDANLNEDVEGKEENGGDEDDIEEDDVESFVFNNFSDNMEDDDDKVNDELFDDDIDIDEKSLFNTTSTKDIEELEIEQNHNLEFEKYSYVSEPIPVGIG